MISKKLIVLLVTFALGAACWFLSHRHSLDPKDLLKSSRLSPQAFERKSLEIAAGLTDRAVQEIQDGQLDRAIKDLKTAIDILPLYGRAYGLLAKLYLMRGQEHNLYETLNLAGNSFPDFNDIVNVVDDADLDRIPLPQPQEPIYLAQFPGNKQMAISFSFDDGAADIYDHLPIFEKYGFRATLPIIAGFVPKKDDDPQRASWHKWRDAADRGFEIANHSMYHRNTKYLSPHDLDICIIDSKELIEKNIGHKIKTFVFPGGSSSEAALALATKTHLLIRQLQFLHAVDDRTIGIVYGGPYFSVATANRLIDIGIKRHLWIIAKCHEITPDTRSKSFKPITPAFLDAHLAYIHGRSNDVYVDTLSNAYEYVYARSKTRLTITDLSATSADFILHHDSSKEQLTRPLTVVLKSPAGATGSAQTASGHPLKTWTCGRGQLCVDVDAYDENVHLAW